MQIAWDDGRASRSLCWMPAPVADSISPWLVVIQRPVVCVCASVGAQHFLQEVVVRDSSLRAIFCTLLLCAHNAKHITILC